MVKSNDISLVIKDIITAMMERVMENVLINDPFIPEEHRAKKPLYSALVPDEIFKGSHFERRFVTPFGKVWEKLAQAAGEKGHGSAVLGKVINGTIKEERLRRISEILNRLEHPVSGKKRIKPNWENELKYVLEGDGNEIPVSVVCDLFIKDNHSHESYAFELKAPLPNSDQTKVSKEKILKLYSMTIMQITEAYYSLPYNPYGSKENYNWSFPMRWFDMKNDRVVLIGDEFWDLIGGEGTYQIFIAEINKLGKEYRERIYKEFLGIEPPERDNMVSL